MAPEIRTYQTIGQFFDDLTRLEKRQKITFIGEFKLWQPPEQDIENDLIRGIPLFEFSCLPSTEISIGLTEHDFSEYLADQYTLRFREKGSGGPSAIRLPIQHGSWQTHYQYNGADSRVRGEIGDGLILDLEPEIKCQKT